MSEIINPPVEVHRLPERAVFEEHDTVLGRTIWCRQVDPGLDVPLIHHWMNQDFVAEFWEMAWPADLIADYLRRNFEDPHRTAYVGFVGDDPIGYLEVYDPTHDVLGSFYEPLPGDTGAHVLIGDEEYLGRFSVALGSACVRFLFRPSHVRRIVAEPDARNHQMLSLLAFLGFRKQGEIDLPDKRAALMACQRRDFERLSARRRVRTLR